MAQHQEEQGSYPHYQYSSFYQQTENFQQDTLGPGGGAEYQTRPASCPSQQLGLQGPGHSDQVYQGPHYPMGSMKCEPEDYDMSGYPAGPYPGAGYGYSEVERYKLERKRERNRIAATKCRMRKMERIAQLDQEVAELKSQNSRLSQVGESLRGEVASLRTRLKEHVGSGCQVDCSSLGQSSKTGPDSTC